MTTDHPRHIVAVAGVVRNAAGELLLVRTPRRGWEPPGGQVELREDLITALEREVFEESGCEVRVDRLVGVHSNVGEEPKVQFVFLCHYLRGTLRPSEETPEVGWFGEAEALALVTHPAQCDKLKDALHAEGVLYRSYTLRPYRIGRERMF